MTDLELMRAIHAHTVKHLAVASGWAGSARSEGQPCPWLFGVEACGVGARVHERPAIEDRVMGVLRAAAGATFYSRFATEPDDVIRDFARHVARMEELEAAPFEQPEMVSVT